MHDRTGGGNDHSLQSIDDDKLRNTCRKHTDLSEDEIAILIETSHILPTVHDLEGGDIFIDCLTKGGKKAVVIAQYSPPGTNYTRNIVGELMVANNEPGVFRTLQIGVPSRKLKAVVTGDYLIRQNVSAIRNKNGNVIGVLIVERHIQGAELWDVVGEDAVPDLLKASYDAREMERVGEFMNDGMVRFNSHAVAVYANSRARQIFQGLNYMDDIIGMPFENLTFDNVSFADISQTGRITRSEVKIGEYILNVVYAPINDGESFTGAIMIIEDATEEKNIEKELILKGAVIDEIHHRVKNNLQTIISLLRMQRRRIDNADARTAFSETMSRIFSISLTHEILAQTGMDNVDIKEMLCRILDNARSYIMPDNLDLSIEIGGDSILLESSAATSIAMVVNELVQNCIKHAFVDRNKGAISLRITKGESISGIEVSDDGIGYSTLYVREGSLGHKLVNSLVNEKLFGKLEIRSSCTGTSVYFTFLNDADTYRKKKREAFSRSFNSNTHGGAVLETVPVTD